MSCITDYSLFGGGCIDKCPDEYTSNNGVCSGIIHLFHFEIIKH